LFVNMRDWNLVSPARLARLDRQFNSS